MLYQLEAWTGWQVAAGVFRFLIPSARFLGRHHLDSLLGGPIAYSLSLWLKPSYQWIIQWEFQQHE